MEEHQQILKKNDYIKGDFDMIVPNVKKRMFENMLINNFQKNGNHKFIFGTEKELPETFNLFIEVGLYTFKNV
jgi:hypothetical protein